MSKRLRTQGQTQDTPQTKSGEDMRTKARATEGGTSQEAGQSPKKLMLLMWGIPLLLVLASVLVQKYT